MLPVMVFQVAFPFPSMLPLFCGERTLPDPGWMATELVYPYLLGSARPV